jgi:hypothetical protein
MAHPCIMKVGYHRGGFAAGQRRTVWYCESAQNLTWELSAPRIVAFEHAEQTRDRDASPGGGDTGSGRRRYGTRDRAVWWTGRAQEDGGGVCPGSRAQRGAQPARADLRDDGGFTVATAVPKRISIPLRFGLAASGNRSTLNHEGDHSGARATRPSPSTSASANTIEPRENTINIVLAALLRIGSGGQTSVWLPSHAFPPRMGRLRVRVSRRRRDRTTHAGPDREAYWLAARGPVSHTRDNFCFQPTGSAGG